MRPNDKPATIEAPVVSAPVSLEGFARLLRVFLEWLSAFAVITGIALPLQFWFGLRKFGGEEYALRVIGIAVVRELAASIVFAAGLFTWISVTHGLAAHRTRSRFRPIAAQMVAAGVIGLPLALVMTTLTSLAVCMAFLGIGLTQYETSWSTTIVANDYLAGIAALAEMLVLLLLTGWLSVPFIAGLKWKLRHKLLATWAALAAIRMVLAILPS